MPSTIEADAENILQFMEHMPFPMLFTDSEGRIVFANELFLHVVSRNEADLKNKPFRQFVQFTDNKNGFEEKQATFAWREGEIMNGDRRVPSTICCQRWTEEGQAYYLVFFVSLTKGSSLGVVQRFAESFISDVNIGVLVFDRAERLIELSDEACRLLGVKRRDVLYKSLSDAFPEMPNEQLLLHNDLLKGVTVQNQVTSWTTNNKRYELLMDSNLLCDEAGEVVAAYILFKDITNLRSLDEQIQRNDRLAMIGQIAAGTAHEIRNPLTSIKGFLQVLKYGLTEKGLLKEREYTDIMLKEIDRINDLVSQFLLLSKPRNAKYEEVEVQAVLLELLPFIENEALLHKVDVRHEQCEALPPVIADSELLKQIFLNLCKNGIEAMPDGGVLTIREDYLEAENKIVLDIHDTGPGIPPYLIDKIFDPFFTSKDNGTGLGLPVCQRIIHEIGGSLRVSTKGFGTTFSVLLPSYSPKR